MTRDAGPARGGVDLLDPVTPDRFSERERPSTPVRGPEDGGWVRIDAPDRHATQRWKVPGEALVFAAIFCLGVAQAVYAVL
ncbi:hypothetical protein NOLU111490_02970 [Novosphingobium lubricantis]|jgi:hypothetical protein